LSGRALKQKINISQLILKHRAPRWVLGTAVWTDLTLQILLK